MIDQAFKEYVPTIAEGSQAFVDGVLLKDNPYMAAHDEVKARWWAKGWRATRDLTAGCIDTDPSALGRTFG